MKRKARSRRPNSRPPGGQRFCLKQIEKGDKKMKIEEIMTPDPACCTDRASLSEVAQMMLDNDCGCIPVVENLENKKPIGMITDRDITIRTVAHNKNPLNMIAGEVMTDAVISVTMDASVEDACRRMEINKIRRLAVVDGTGALCGIVAQSDIARRTSEHLTAELVKDVSAPAYMTA
jgi:CBS domain-containing protein